jgi:zinc transport system substrate-binding protein
MAYFAERIAGARALVSLPVPAGADPAYWRPQARAIAEMQRADAIVLNGADYETWLPKVSLPLFKRIDAAAAFKSQFILIENALTHSHGPGGEHTHTGTASTTWLDFSLASQQATAIAQGLARQRPELKSAFQENLHVLQAELDGLDARMQALAAQHKGRPLLASHPVYQYLARRYGLKLRSVHWEPGQMPEAGEWENLKQILSAHPAQWMLWEAAPAPEIAAKLKALGVASVVFSPCANRPEQGDFLETMRRNMDNFEAVLRE